VKASIPEGANPLSLLDVSKQKISQKGKKDFLDRTNPYETFLNK